MSRQAGVAGIGLVLAAALVTLALGGVGLELWRVVDEHRRLSGLAEGATLSGAAAIDVAALYRGQESPVLDPELAVERACDYLVRHGDVACGSGAQVTVTGAAIEVTVRSRLELTLLRLISAGGGAPIEVVARSTAVAVRSR